MRVLVCGGRLHSADGPALLYPDDWGLYCWHGFVLPASHEWIVRNCDKLNPEKIEAEANAELRRIMLEAYGYERYLRERNAKVIAADKLHGKPRRLLEVAVGRDRVRIIEVINGSDEPDGTRRKFHLGAMPGDTPNEVIAASYGIAPDKYREAVRT